MINNQPGNYQHLMDDLAVKYEEARLIHTRAWNTIARYVEQPCFHDGVELPGSVTQFILAIGKAAPGLVEYRRNIDVIYPYLTAFQRIAEDTKGFVLLGIGYQPNPPAIIAGFRRRGITGKTVLANTTFSGIVDILNFNRMEPIPLTDIVLSRSLKEAQAVIYDPTFSA